MTEDQLILVNENDQQIGVCGKMEAHEKGLLHRAFSVFLFDGDKLLIQRRAASKYHCAGLWANSCCSHPRDGEEMMDAVQRRLMDETGVDSRDCSLIDSGSFIYKVDFDNGLTEHECDHVIIGEYGGHFQRNPQEADEMEYVSISWLQEDMINNSDKYAYWFIKALPMALSARRERGEL